jgi:hypothetical protein
VRVIVEGVSPPHRRGARADHGLDLAGGDSPSGRAATAMVFQMTWWQRHGFIKATIPLKDIVDTSFVEAAVKAIGD